MTVPALVTVWTEVMVVLVDESGSGSLLLEVVVAAAAVSLLLDVVFAVVYKHIVSLMVFRMGKIYIKKVCPRQKRKSQHTVTLIDEVVSVDFSLVSDVEVEVSSEEEEVVTESCTVSVSVSI